MNIGPRLDALRHAAALQERLCREHGSPTYAAILSVLCRELEAGQDVTGLLLEDEREPVSSALFLRLLGAVHRCAMRDAQASLRRWYPTLGGTADPRRAASAFLDYVTAHRQVIATEMREDVQTNEVGRSAPLSAAMNHVAALTGLPLRLLELGASAGLNLNMDTYRVVAGDRSWGPRDAPVQLTGQFVAGTPPAGGFRVATRRGCDLRPLDPGQQRTRELLHSFVWPEHTERWARLGRALATPLTGVVDQADAQVWLAEQLTSIDDGLTTVVFHSIVMPYLAGPAQQAIEKTIRAAMDCADRRAPVAWIRLEPSGSYADIELTCEVAPYHARTLLATCGPHGGSVRWLAGGT